MSQHAEMPENPVFRLRDLAAKSRDVLSKADLFELATLPDDVLLVVASNAERQEPPNEGVMVAAGAIAMMRIVTNTHTQGDVLMSVIYTAFPNA